MNLIASILVFSVAALLSTVSNADSGDGCYIGHEAEIEGMMKKSLENDLVDFGVKNGISFDLSSMELPLEAGPLSPQAAPTETYIGFNLLGHIDGISGTEFRLYFNGGQDPFVWYKVISTKSAYDKEGNVINGHCTLKLVAAVPGAEPSQTFFVLENKRTGRKVAKFPLEQIYKVY